MEDDSSSATGSEISRDHLQELSKSLSSCWMDVARYLGMPEDSIKDIEVANPRDQKRASMDMLLKWKNDCGVNATYEKLDHALRKAGRTSLAEKLQGLRASHVSVSGVSHGEDVARDETDAPTSRLLPCYEMSSKPRGVCLIITYGRNRPGNESDKVNLVKIFEELDFKIIEDHNLNLEQTRKLIRKTAEMDYKSYNCFVLFICSHGGEDTIQAEDGQNISIQEVLTPFKAEHCGTLKGKPKIFFFNSCRGENKHRGILTEDDEQGDRGPGAHTESYRPNEADFCISLSTVPGYVSRRDKKKGTRFVQSLSKCINDYNLKHFHLLDILTLVNKDLIDSYRPYKGTSEEELFCQEGTIISTLDKAVYFSTPQ